MTEGPSDPPDPRDRPRPDLPAIVAALRRHRVDWVLSGSAVLTVYGAAVEPNDVDVVPAAEQENLRRLAALLRAVDAVPAYFPDWADGPTLEQCRSWLPEPATLARLDHLYVTRLGMIDVPPELTGTYADLRAGASLLEVAGAPVWVCDPHEVLDRLPDPPRAKDRARAAGYAELRERLRTGAGLPVTLPAD